MTDVASHPRDDAVDAAAAILDQRLATLQLRLGNLMPARAELEDLHRRGVLDVSGVADLADARWRTGDIDGAEAAAVEHLAAGGSRRIALVVAAEAAAAAGRPVEARAHVEAMGAVDGAALERLFAGMPRRAFWPSAPSAPIEPHDTLFGAERGTGPRVATGSGGPTSAAPELGSVPVAQPEEPGLWADDEPALARSVPGPRQRGPIDPREELARARDEARSEREVVAERGMARLALVLRLDPTLAPAVLDAVGPRRDAAALFVRGDAYRLLGRHLDAEAAFAAAADALDHEGR